MTGVQTCALPICFPVTIELLKNGDVRTDTQIKSEMTHEKIYAREYTIYKTLGTVDDTTTLAPQWVLDKAQWLYPEWFTERTYLVSEELLSQIVANDVSLGPMTKDVYFNRVKTKISSSNGIDIDRYLPLECKYLYDHTRYVANMHYFKNRMGHLYNEPFCESPT